MVTLLFHSPRPQGTNHRRDTHKQIHTQNFNIQEIIKNQI